MRFAVTLREAARADHNVTSPSTKARKTMLITPFIVKNAAFEPAQVARPNERVLEGEEPGDRGDAEPVSDAHRAEVRADEQRRP